MVESGVVRRVTRKLLAAAVRGRRQRGGPWGEAVLAEFDRTSGGWEAMRWAAGGVRAVWRERRAVARALPRPVRIQRAVATTAVVGLIAAFVINQFALTGRYVATEALTPALPPSSRVLLDKVGFRLTGLGHGDLVEFRDSADRRYLRPVVGLSGEAIECRDGQIYRNGMAVGLAADCAAVTVPPGRLYVLGGGLIAESSVDGRVVARVWPLSG
jgi:signal peptidase I